MSAAALPDGPLLAYYGDDFTGSTDVMEVMTFAGLPTVLFLGTPTNAQLRRFAGYRGIGMAGIARARSPAWMDEHLPAVFHTLAALDAPITQYKVCSTFDSSPTVGSIGHAIDLGLPIVGATWSPLVVAAPRLRRYQLFGNLFASVDGVGYRLDRHPTMARHPVTPMREADLRRHLAAQTSRPVGLVDAVALKAGRGKEALAAARARGAEIVLIDVLDEATLVEAGRLVWEERGQGVFGASSSGLQYALVAWWQAAGLLPQAGAPAGGRSADRILAVSGSCSPVTAGQIAWAAEHGFAAIRLDVAALLDAADRRGELARAAEQARGALGRGRDPLLFTASGPDDPALARFEETVERRGLDREEAQAALGDALGELLASLLDTTGTRRCVVAGGDSSGQAASRLGIAALTAIAPLAPGSPLCRAWSDDPARDGLEIALKGGQVGGPDYFGAVKAGRALT